MVNLISAAVEQFNETAKGFANDPLPTLAVQLRDETPSPETPPELPPVEDGSPSFVGVGGFYFNPKAKYEGKWVSLQPLGTEGQGLNGK